MDLPVNYNNTLSLIYWSSKMADSSKEIAIFHEKDDEVKLYDDINSIEIRPMLMCKKFILNYNNFSVIITEDG